MILPIVLIAALAGMGIIGGGAVVYEQETAGTEFPCIICHPKPSPPTPAPKATPKLDRSLHVGPRPKSAPPLIVKKIAPPEPSIDKTPTPYVPEVAPQEEAPTPAPVEPATKVQTTKVQEPEQPYKPAYPVEGWGAWLLWELFYTVIILGAIGIMATAGKRVYAIYQSSKKGN